MYIVRFKEFNFEYSGFKDLYYTNDRVQAEIAAEMLTHELDKLKKEIRDKDLHGGIFIPEIDVFCTAFSDLSIEVVEIPRLENVPRLSLKAIVN